MIATVESAYTQAWTLLTRHFWVLLGCLGVVILGLVPVYVFAFAGVLMQGRSASHALAQLFLTACQMIWQYAVFLPLEYGLFRVLAQAARGANPDVMEVFWPFRSIRNWLTTIAHAILLILIVLAVMLPVIVLLLVFVCGAAVAAAASPEDAMAAAIGAMGLGAFLLLLLGLVPAIWIQVRTGMSYFFVTEGELGPVAAIAASWRTSRGHFMTLFLTWLLAIPVALLGMLACLVGIIPAALLIGLAFASVYVALTPRQAPAVTT